jgi:hypothetical protein
VASGKFFLITVAGPRRTYTGFPFMPLRAPRVLLDPLLQCGPWDVNGMKTLSLEQRTTRAQGPGGPIPAQICDRERRDVDAPECLGGRFENADNR